MLSISASYRVNGQRQFLRLRQEIRVCPCVSVEINFRRDLSTASEHVWDLTAEVDRRGDSPVSGEWHKGRGTWRGGTPTGVNASIAISTLGTLNQYFEQISFAVPSGDGFAVGSRYATSWNAR